MKTLKIEERKIACMMHEKVAAKILENIWAQLIKRRNLTWSDPGRHHIWQVTLSKLIHGHLETYIKYLREAGCRGPSYVPVNTMGKTNLKIRFDYFDRWFHPASLSIYITKCFSGGA